MDFSALIQSAEQELSQLDQRRVELVAQIDELKRAHKYFSLKKPSLDTINTLAEASSNIYVTGESPTVAKTALFRSLFRGREDVFPRRFESKTTGRSGYQPVCKNEWVSGICKKPSIKCGKCSARVFIPVSNQIIHNHLMGYDPSDRSRRDYTIGVYPLLTDNTCWFLAADFDKTTWQEDAIAFIRKCHSLSIPAVLERSRSGKGGHVWIFFEEPLPASIARRMGSYILTEAMEERPEMGFASYDRFFPNQDVIPNERYGFGNLIALPFQRRAAEDGNSLFIDENFLPYNDQWNFLSNIKRMPMERVETIANEAVQKGKVTGVRMAVTDENDDAPWTAPPSRRFKETPLNGRMPERIDLTLGDQIYIPKDILPPSLRNRLLRIAAFQNPEFFRAQAMKMSTFGKPRIISCAEDHENFISLPRGCLDDIKLLFESAHIQYAFTDKRGNGFPVISSFKGDLHSDQMSAVNALSMHDTGVLSASTAFGKTICAIFLIALRGVNTLIVVNRKQLLLQWMDRLHSFLDIPADSIGCIGGGKRKPTGKIDVAIIQSLCRKNIVDDIVGDYGQIIVDECHHITAPTFELVARRCKARYFLGLSATIIRKDGQHPVIFMQLGPLRYHVSEKEQAALRPFAQEVIVKKTTFTLPSGNEELSIQEIYSKLCTDTDRNQMTLNDIFLALDDGRFPLVLSERREHVEFYCQPWRRSPDAHKPTVLFLSRQGVILAKGSMTRDSTPFFLPIRYHGEVRCRSTQDESIGFITQNRRL
jgi:hypothetical protein